MSSSMALDPNAPVTGLSEIERVVDTFVAPSKTFRDILRKATWWLPFLLMVFSSLATAYVIDHQIGFDRVYQNQLHSSPSSEERMSSMDPAQKAQVIKIGTISMKASSYGLPVILLIILGIYSLLIWASFNFGLGAQTTFWQVLAVTWYAALPYLFTSLLSILTIYFGGNSEAYDLKNPVGTNLAYYLPDAPGWLRGALSSVDIIKIWSDVLQVIGMSIIAKKSIAQSAIIVGLFWLLGVLVGAAGGAFGG